MARELHVLTRDVCSGRARNMFDDAATARVFARPGDTLDRYVLVKTEVVGEPQVTDRPGQPSPYS